MRAVYVESFNTEKPLTALAMGERPDPDLPDGGWALVRVRASSLNHHDLWSLRGVGLRADRLPMVLGCDAAGIGPDGAEVVIYPVVSDPDDPRGYSILSERLPGTFADLVAVPRANLVAKPAALSFADAACLPTAWLTAYRMLTTKGRLGRAAASTTAAGTTASTTASAAFTGTTASTTVAGASSGSAVLVQGAGGGVATAAVVLARALGHRVYATSRDAAKRERIAALGATAVEPGARLPERVQVVIETVGSATFEHSLKCAAAGARIVVSGATAGHQATLDLRRVFALQLEILGSSMGTAGELAELMALCVELGIHPVIDTVYGFSEAAEAFARMHSGDVFGKLVLDHTQ